MSSASAERGANNKRATIATQLHQRTKAGTPGKYAQSVKRAGLTFARQAGNSSMEVLHLPAMYSLRPMEELDLPMVLEWRNHPDVRKNMYTQHVISREEHSAWFQRLKTDATKRYFICVNGNEPVGVVGFYSINATHKTAEWAFYSGNVSSRGVGSQMEFLALSYAFETLELQKLSCEVLDFNQSVIAFHRKHGFRQEGVRRKQYFLDGQYRDVHLLALFRHDWLGGLQEECRRRLDGQRDQHRFRVGAAHRVDAVITSDFVGEYARIIGDANPVHFSNDAARAAGFTGPIAHGMLLGGLISRVLGNEFPGPGTIYREQNLSFKRPVAVGDAVTIQIVVLSRVGRIVTLSTSVLNRAKETVIAGEAVVSLPSLGD